MDQVVDAALVDLLDLETLVSVFVSEVAVTPTSQVGIPTTPANALRCGLLICTVTCTPS